MRDPFLVFERLLKPRLGGADDQHAPAEIDPSHAFYLGYEMAKAAIALTLSKQYRQDKALNWGYLTEPEESHRLRKQAASRPSNESSSSTEGTTMTDMADSGEQRPASRCRTTSPPDVESALLHSPPGHRLVCSIAQCTNSARCVFVSDSRPFAWLTAMPASRTAPTGWKSN